MSKYSEDIKKLSKKTKISQQTLDCIKIFYSKKEDWFEKFCMNPYEIMEVTGFGFKRCDELANKIRFDMYSNHRVVGCIKYAIELVANGNTIVELSSVLDEAMNILERKDRTNIENIIKENESKCGYLMYDKMLKRNNVKPFYITLEWWKNTEQGLVELCKRANMFENKSEEEINNAIDVVEKRLEFPLNEKQRKAFTEIPHGKVNILSGLGGCCTKDTEVLTKNGWIKISEWNGQEIMVSEIDYNDVVQRYKFEMPLKYHRYEKSMFFDIVLECGSKITVSTEHKNILYKNGLILIKRTFEMINELDFENDVIEIQIFKNRKSGLEKKRVVSIEISEKNKTEKEMFCFTTTTGYFLAKYNGIEFATGNSGKSYTTRAILDVLDELGETYELLTPTGCSSKVLSNATKRESMTIHRKYYADYIMREEKIDSDWIIIDEVSMCALEHFRMIFEMIHKAPIKLLFIGDISQLIPISEGCCFRDMINLIESDMINGNVTHLIEIMRSQKDSAISHMCKMFTKHGDYDSNQLEKKHKGVEFIKLNKSNFTGQIEDIIKSKKLKLDETFILSPLNIREFGNNVINNHIQEVFSKGNVIYEDRYKKYKLGDYLMHTKNNSRLGIFNGERIRLVDKLKSEYKNGREIKMYRCQKVDEPNVYIKYNEFTLMTETMLSYAISIHKSQGASLSNVIVVFDSSHSFVLSRNSVYTAMSRASKNLIVLYDEDALQFASEKNDVEKRNTFLRALWGINMKRRMGGI
ncbi:MAG: AAA family ATPase [Clostridium sp.]|uniref:AAA family ATPase n=1 Tax=Clostridium sp. TaxID=1506 RepID=UPI003EE63B53